MRILDKSNIPVWFQSSQNSNPSAAPPEHQTCERESQTALLCQTSEGVWGGGIWIGEKTLMKTSTSPKMRRQRNPLTHTRITVSHTSCLVVSHVYSQTPTELGALYSDPSASTALSCTVSDCSKTPRNKVSLPAVPAEGHEEDLFIAGFWATTQWFARSLGGLCLLPPYITPTFKHKPWTPHHTEKQPRSHLPGRAGEAGRQKNEQNKLQPGIDSRPGKERHQTDPSIIQARPASACGSDSFQGQAHESQRLFGHLSSCHPVGSVLVLIKLGKVRVNLSA